MDEFGREQKIAMHGDELVNFAGITSRLPTPEEIEMILHFSATQYADETASLFELSEDEKKKVYDDAVRDDRLTFSSTSFVTEFSHLNIRLVTTCDFRIQHSINDTDHTIDVSYLRWIIRDNNIVEELPTDHEFFSL